MDKTKSNGIDWGSLIIGVLLVITALLSFGNPMGNLASMVIIFAVLAIMKGFFEIFIRNKIKVLTGYKLYSVLTLGIANILIGIFFLFNINAGIVALPFIFAVWFTLDSLFSLFTLNLEKVVNKEYFWFSTFINILGVVLGVMMFLDPITSVLTISFLIGLYFLLIGLNYIVYAFTSRS